MSDYVSAPWEINIEQRDYQRRRVQQVIAGWLRREYRPRAVAAVFLFGSLAVGWLIIHSLGDWLAMPAVFRGLFFPVAAWPFYAFGMSWFSNRLGCRFLATAGKEKELLPDRRDDLNPAEPVCGVINQVCESARHQQNSGPAVLFLSVVSGGLWLAGEIIAMSPKLLAATVLDSAVVTAYPNLLNHISTKDWRRELWGGTVFYFLAMSLCSVTLWLVCTWIYAQRSMNRY